MVACYPRRIAQRHVGREVSLDTLFMPPQAPMSKNTSSSLLSTTSASSSRTVSTRTIIIGLPENHPSPAGHDYQGRSSSWEGFALWTHGIKGITRNQKFVPAGCKTTPTDTITVAAGEQWIDVYGFADDAGVLIVGGGCDTVGAGGGWLLGGGHSVLSPSYGLGVDNLLEAEIVTADGKLQTISECSNPDLFWYVTCFRSLSFAYDRLQGDPRWWCGYLGCIDAGHIQSPPCCPTLRHHPRTNQHYDGREHAIDQRDSHHITSTARYGRRKLLRGTS